MQSIKAHFIVDNCAISTYLEQFGTSSSLGLFHPQCNFFSTPSINGIIGYRLERNCAIGIGDPVCSLQDRLPLAHAFHDFCKKNNKKNAYVMASESFMKEALHHLGGSALQYGDEIIINPTIDAKSCEGKYPSQLRQRYKKALSSGLSAHEYDGNTPELKQRFLSITTEWMRNRKGPQIFLLPLDIAHASSHRWFYAKKDNNIVGFLMLHRAGFKSWALNGTITLTPEAPKGTSELLMIYTLEVLRSEGSLGLSIGPTLSAEIGKIEGFGWFSRKLMIGTLKTVRTVFKLHEKQRFWKKFLPRKEPSFLIFNSSRVGLNEILALLRVFNVNI